MQRQDEKKPPVGGVQMDVAQLGARHRVLGRLLAAREELLQAVGVARLRSYPAAGQAVEDFIAQDMDRLLARVVPLLDRPERPEDYEVRVGLRPGQ